MPIIYDARCAYCDEHLGKRQVKAGQTLTFCNSSHAASYSNRGVQRHGKPPKACEHCGAQTRNPRYCSNKCAGESNIIYKTKEAKEKSILLKNRRTAAKYYSKKVSNTPEVSKLEKQLINEFYDNCPDGYEVDHIYPVSKGGWHVLSNLQYLPMRENRQKSNKIEDNTAPWGYIEKKLLTS